MTRAFGVCFENSETIFVSSKYTFFILLKSSMPMGLLNSLDIPVTA